MIAGVGCIECHGRIDQMERVRTVKPFSMAWCLECHKDAAGKLRPADQVTNMTWKPSHDWMKLAKRKASKLNPPVESCSGCHR